MLSGESSGFDPGGVTLNSVYRKLEFLIKNNRFFYG